MARKVLQVQRALKVYKALKVIQVQRARKVQQVRQVQLETWAQQAHKAQQELGWFRGLISRWPLVHPRRRDSLYWEQPRLRIEMGIMSFTTRH